MKSLYLDSIPHVGGVEGRGLVVHVLRHDWHPVGESLSAAAAAVRRSAAAADRCRRFLAAASAAAP